MYWLTKQNLEIIAMRDSKKGQENGQVCADDIRVNDCANLQIAMSERDLQKT